MAHLDIKLENIVLDKFFMLKLIDFAYSEPKDSLMCVAKGTERYFAPEVAKIFY
jgi:serine/threonine protein kinase